MGEQAVPVEHEGLARVRRRLLGCAQPGVRPAERLSRHGELATPPTSAPTCPPTSAPTSAPSGRAMREALRELGDTWGEGEGLG